MSIEGKRIALTGKLRRISRSDATSQLEDLGAEVTAVVTEDTDLVVADPDSVAPRIRNVPVIDEVALEQLLSGTALSTILGTTAAEAPPRPPLPPIVWERDGQYRRADVEGRIRVEGSTVAARMHGTWRYFAANGQLVREVEYLDGLEHGPELEWNDRGVPTYRGQNANGRSVGTCEWFHADGVTVSSRTDFVDGEPHGEHREQHPDGSPRVIGRNVRGRAEGMWSWIAPDGTRTERRYRGGFLVATPTPIEADDETVEQVVRAVKRARDRLAKEAALETIASDGNRFVLMALWRLRALELPKEPELWELLAEAAIDPACNVTGAELVEILAAISPRAKLGGGHLDGWPLALDRATCHVIARDPEPFLASVPGMALVIRRGIDSALARAGLVERARLGDLADPLAKALVGGMPLPPICWFDGGFVVERELVDNGELTAAFDAMIDLYTTRGSWGRASLARAFARGVRGLDLVRLHDAAQLATAEQLASMIERGERGETVAPFLLASRLPPATLADVALGASEPRALWAAAIRFGDAGVPIPEPVWSAIGFEGATVGNVRRLQRAIATIPILHRDEPALVATLVRFTDDLHPLLESLGIPRRAARALGPRLSEVLRRELARGHALAVAPLLPLVEDPSFLASALTTIRQQRPLAQGHLVGAALGMLPRAALPLLSRAHDDETDPEMREWLGVAIVGVLARAASSGATWDAAFDRFLRTDLGETAEERRCIDPLVCAAIAGLPEARAEAVLLANLDISQRERFTRAFELLGLCATPKLVAHALGALLDVEATLLDSDVDRIEAGLKGLFEPDEHVRWLLAAGAGSRLGSALVGVVGNEEKLEALRSEVVASGARVARALDSIDVLEAMVGRLAEATKQTIYLLRPVDDRPSDAGLNRIGGVPVGVTTRRWPKHRGKPMAHVLTLDVLTMPALAKVLEPDARTVSVFVANPDAADAIEPGNDRTRVLVMTSKDVARAELAPPSAVRIREAAWFEPVPVEVPVAVFGARAGTLRELREEIAKHPRVLGEPIWHGEPAHRGTLLAQFDASFVGVSSHDGCMFVFADTAFWQR